jgi:hypothetical protein
MLRKISLFVFLFFTLSLQFGFQALAINGKANPPFKVYVQQETGANMIDSFNFTVSGLKAGQPISKMIAKYGKPDSMMQEAFDDGSGFVNEYYYKRSYVAVYNDTIMSFNIRNKGFKLFDKFAVGQNADQLKSWFPESFSKRKDPDHIDIYYKDKNIQFQINIKDGKIESFNGPFFMM